MTTSKKTPEGADGAKDAIELLKADHREVETLFGQFAETKERSQRRELIEKIAAALTAHTLIEEEIFYPACREKGVEDHDLDEAQVEHDTVKLLIADLLRGTQDHDYYDAKVTVLSEYVKHHVGEEESPSDGIFARAKSAGLDMEALGKKLQERKDELMADEPQLLARPPQIRSLNLSQLHQEYGDMARYPSDRYRDDERRYGGHRSPGREYRGVDYDDERHGSSVQRGSRAEFYRNDYDEDFGPNRGAWGESDYDRSAEGYRDDRHAGPRRDFYGENARSAYGRPGYPDHRHSEHDHDHRQHRGPDREYYQGTRYGSSYGGGRYPQGEDDRNYDRGERYYSGQGHGTTRGGDYGGQSAYGSGSGSEYDDGDYEGRGPSMERGRPGYGTGDYRRRGGSPGYRGNR